MKEELIDKWQDAYECLENDDWTERNLIQEFLDDLKRL